MRRPRIILVVLFLIGVLLGGVGVGVTMMEWSSLRYDGTKLLGSEYLVTEDFDFKLKEDDSLIALKYSYYTNRYLDKIEEDPSVPKGIVRYQVTYNNTLVKPYLEYVEYDREEETEPVFDGQLRLQVDYHGDDFRTVMENKDAILRDLKAGKLSSYEIASVTGVRIMVNPATMPRVEDQLR